MEIVTETERKRRHRIVDSTVGTHVMEGLQPDAATRQIMERWAEGELSIEQFSAAMQRHAEEVIAEVR